MLLSTSYLSSDEVYWLAKDLVLKKTSIWIVPFWWLCLSSSSSLQWYRCITLQERPHLNKKKQWSIIISACDALFTSVGTITTIKFQHGSCRDNNFVILGLISLLFFLIVFQVSNCQNIRAHFFVLVVNHFLEHQLKVSFIG